VNLAVGTYTGWVSLSAMADSAQDSVGAKSRNFFLIRISEFCLASGKPHGFNCLRV
jgi:hypothetical protein